LETIRTIIVRMKAEYCAEAQVGHLAWKVEEGRKEFEATREKMREKNNIAQLNETMKAVSQMTELLMKEGADGVDSLGADEGRSLKRKLVEEVEAHLLTAAELTKRLKK
jgi:hypothetical protein